MRLLNKSKELFKYTVLTVITLVILLFCIVQWKGSFEKGIDKFLTKHTVVTNKSDLEKGYTYRENSTGLYAQSSKEVMALAEMNHVPTVIILIDLVFLYFFAKFALIEYKKVSNYISEQAELEEELQRDKKEKEE